MDIAAAKKRCEAATGGPWLAIPIQKLAAAGNFMMEWSIVTSTKRGVMKKIRTEADAELAAHARTDLPAALEALEEVQANQHDSEICVPKHLYDECNTKGRELIEAVIPLLDAIRGCDNEIVLGVVRPHSGTVGDIIDRILRGTKEEGEA